MAIEQAMCTSFKAELMLAVHDFRVTTGDTFKLALYTSSATINANTTEYTATNEVVGTNYVAGGEALPIQVWLKQKLALLRVLGLQTLLTLRFPT
jgi:hypothetical protein